MASDIKSKRERLQKTIGKNPKIRVGDFENWGETQKIADVLTCRPTSLSELSAVVKGCRRLAIRVRAAGATHSWSPLFSDEGQMVVYTADLKRHDGPQIELLQNPDDDSEKHVTVMTNVTTGDLMEFEISHGVCLPSNVILRPVTLGGVVAPMCHGVGRDCKTVSDYVTSMRIVDSDGELRTYSLKDDGADVMRAIQGNMGLFGLIYDMTFDVSNMIIVDTTTRYEKVSKVFYDREYIKEMFEGNWSVEVFWFPFNGMSLGEITESVFEREIDCGEWEPKDDEVWIRLVNKAERVGELKPRQAYRMDGVRSKLEHAFGSFIDGIITTNPALTASFGQTEHRFLRANQPEGTVQQQLTHAVHFRDHVEGMKVRDMEWAIDCDDNYDNYMKATQFVIRRLKSLAAEGKFPVNIALELRLVGHSDVYLSPALAGSPQTGGSGRTLYIELLSLAGTRGYEEFMGEVSEVWRGLPGARPHWAKEWSYLDGIDDHIRKMYKSQIPKFLNQLSKSKADPEGIFLNSRLESLLYPGGHPGWRKLSEISADQEETEGTKGQRRKNESKTCVIL